MLDFTIELIKMKKRFPAIYELYFGEYKSVVCLEKFIIPILLAFQLCAVGGCIYIIIIKLFF